MKTLKDIRDTFTLLETDIEWQENSLTLKQVKRSGKALDTLIEDLEREFNYYKKDGQLLGLIEVVQSSIHRSK